MPRVYCENAMKKVVHVRRADIQKALVDNTHWDPIQVALEREGPGRCIVNSRGFTMIGTPMKHIPFPRDVGDRLIEFEVTGKMQPFEFESEL